MVFVLWLVGQVTLPTADEVTGTLFESVGHESTRAMLITDKGLSALSSFVYCSR